MEIEARWSGEIERKIAEFAAWIIDNQPADCSIPIDNYAIYFKSKLHEAYQEYLADKVIPSFEADLE